MLQKYQYALIFNLECSFIPRNIATPHLCLSMLVSCGVSSNSLDLNVENTPSYQGSTGRKFDSQFSLQACQICFVKALRVSSRSTNNPLATSEEAQGFNVPAM